MNLLTKWEPKVMKVELMKNWMKSTVGEKFLHKGKKTITQKKATMKNKNIDVNKVLKKMADNTEAINVK